MLFREDDKWGGKVPARTSPLRFFFYASRPYWRYAFLAMFLLGISDIIYAGSSYLFKMMVDAAVHVQSGGSFDALMYVGMLYIGVLAVTKLTGRIGIFLSGRWITGSQATARFGLTSYVTLHSRAYFADRFAGSIMTKIRHASAGMREMIDLGCWGTLEIIISMIVNAVLAFMVSSTVGYIFVGWIAVVVFVNWYMSIRRMPYSARTHKLDTELNGSIADLVSNIASMQEYARRDFELMRLRGQIENHRDANLLNWYLGSWNRAINSIILTVFGGFMVYTTVELARAGDISLGSVVLVLTIIFRIEGMLQALGMHFLRLAETWSEIKESLSEIMETHDIKDGTSASRLEVARGTIVFDNVSFGYGEGNDVLRNFNLVINGRQKIGVVGRSGAGKSTIVKLLLRNYDVIAGSIKVDGQNISAVTQDSVRESISLVPQESQLFHRSLRENISYGRPKATQQEVEAAARMAYAHGFIADLPDGYDTLVGERGVKLSGGERQRVAIARAILKNAPILVLDEATSSLDSESETLIQHALHTLMKGKTVIAIAHRLSTLHEMDRIIVVEDGKIAEEGTHDGLIRAGGIYAQLWQKQAGGFLQD